MALIVLKSDDFIGQELSVQIPIYFNCSGLDVVSYMNTSTVAIPIQTNRLRFTNKITHACQGFYYILFNKIDIPATQTYSINQMISAVRNFTFYIIDVYNRLPLADGAFIHCARATILINITLQTYIHFLNMIVNDALRRPALQHYAILVNIITTTVTLPSTAQYVLMKLMC